MVWRINFGRGDEPFLRLALRFFSDRGDSRLAVSSLVMMQSDSPSDQVSLLDGGEFLRRLDLRLPFDFIREPTGLVFLPARFRDRFSWTSDWAL